MNKIIRVINMFNIGDLVTRNSYSNDIVFKIIKSNKKETDVTNTNIL